MIRIKSIFISLLILLAYLSCNAQKKQIQQKSDKEFQLSATDGHDSAVTSTGNANWMHLLFWNLESIDPREHYLDAPYTKCHYIRLVLDTAFKYADENVRADSGARCDIAEFKV